MHTVPNQEITTFQAKLGRLMTFLLLPILVCLFVYIVERLDKVDLPIN